MTGIKSLLRTCLVLLLMFVALFAALYWYFQTRVAVSRFNDGMLVMSDIAYHLLMVHAFWLKGASSLYQLQTQLSVLSEYTGQHIGTAMPIGTSPPGLVLWMPFALFARINLEFAVSAWIAFSLVVLGWAVIDAAFTIFPKSFSCRFRFVVLLLVCMFSITGVSTVLLGQTSLLAAGSMIFLIVNLLGKPITKKPKDDSLLSLLMLLLSLKLPYMLVGGALLVICRRWQALLYSGVLLGLATTVSVVNLNDSWYVDYWQAIQMYASGDIPEAYRLSIVPYTTNVFSSAFTPYIGLLRANTASRYLFLAFMLLLTVFGFYRSGQTMGLEGVSRKLCLSRVFFLLLANFLLFLPYAGAYEDLFILPWLVVAAGANGKNLVTNLSLVLVCPLLLLIMNHNLFPAEKPIIVFWLIKLLVVVCVYWLVFKGSENSTERGKTC